MIKKLYKRQYEYLKNNAKLLFSDIKCIDKNDKYIFIEIDEDFADEIRGELIKRLSVVGFDSNYELTEEGELLENLVDLFYVE